MSVPVSATLAINEALEKRRRAGLPVLPLGFGEAGLPVHPALREALSAHGHHNSYGPVTGLPELRTAAAGYWQRRALPADPDLMIVGPGSKPLLYGLLLSLGGDVVVPAPSWVSYAAQARLTGAQPVHVPAAPGQGGVPQPELLETAVTQARSLGRDVRSVIVTVPDNPTGTVPSRDTVERLAEVARELDLVIVSDEIYRDLVHDDVTLVHSPAEFAPERTVVTTGLSKNLALGGWRMGLARFPDSAAGQQLHSGVAGVASEIWSSPATPVQHAAAFALSEPDQLVERVDRSRRLHGAVARAVCDRLTSAGIPVPTPQAAFYLYPDFQPWREHLAAHGVTSGAELATYLLDSYGMGTVPGAEFEGGDKALRIRLATSMLYGTDEAEQCAALAAEEPTELPWIRAHLDRLETILQELAPGGGDDGATRGHDEATRGHDDVTSAH
ncbi:aminotransferase class I/II-fold pyridoxal phosphate-dependent enzyme [Actinobacteria bacterium YIM 96077]|uniref:Aminotransferase n=1 Tax=Phytoactinopolyspora halophila TaxID=1981511 RepID=A0A329QPI2_9ACTN|nr:aminotransferase class I/II-fold pyridoxal phosphate-dependent enzyme [Phytoactinopolyspora halophila]AYY14548.1 aminotransferase class I/II-fold pyridoxal phosphate-dependent enzyme [Actinobacteria bacterium YIM 96077]RAW14076.1 pyridoxal phosphate-dependent aminotransferase [Phytoactinopolyspora halophila]